MPNYCYNSVQFDGGKETMQQLEILFIALKEKETAEGRAQLPDFIMADEGYMVSIDWESDMLFYETRWTPNNDIIQKIAERFNVGYTHFYEETGCEIYGETSYKDGALTDIFLEPEDFEQYEFIEEEDRWQFEGEYYKDDSEILQILLERKKNAKTN